MSSVAWKPSLADRQVAEVFRHLGVEGVEVAPTTVWDDLSEVTDRHVEEYRHRWSELGIKVIALQSLLYGKPELRLFEEEKARVATMNYLTRVMDIGSILGARVLVFGSPGNRKRGNTSLAEATSIATEVFAELGERACQRDLRFCIEPNPEVYGCDFITTAKEGLDLVRLVGHPGFGLHLDSAAMTLSGEPIVESIAESGPDIAHWHVSEPRLEPVGEHSLVPHEDAARALAAVGYEGWISIEMVQPTTGASEALLTEAIAMTTRRYQKVLS